MRATSGTKNGSLSTLSSPPWGPDPVTTVPVKSTTAATATSNLAMRRTSGGTRLRPAWSVSALYSPAL